MTRKISKEHPTMDAYFDWKSGVQRRGVEVRMSQKEWIKWWSDSGQWANRGRERFNHCMVRLDKEKHYSLDNVELRLIKDKGSKSKHKSNLAPDLK